jgi:putative aldouronate transport system substrate-binding protein
MTIPISDAETSRRNLFRLAGLGAAAVVGGPLLAACGTKPTSSGGVQDISKVSGVLPNFKDLSLPIPAPDVKGIRPIADGYTTFPKDLLDAITEKPGTSGKEVKAMTPVWGPAPPGIDRSAYLQAVNAELGTPINFTAGDGNTYADKLNAMFGARDVPDLLCVPGWEYPKIPRFSQAVAALFEDLTDYVKGDAIAKYPMMATYPTVAWKHAVWNDRVMSIPNDTSFDFGWVLLSRKDLLDKGGHAMPTNFQELLDLGKEVTDPKRKVWAFNDIFPLVQMYFRTPTSQGGWRLRADGTPEFKYETPEFKQALEAMVKVYKDGLVHPDVMASKGADDGALFAPGGQILFIRTGTGAWQGAQAEHQKVIKDLKIAPVPFLSAVPGKDPLAAGAESPISFTFVKKGLGKERVEELLRLINWCSAPFGTKEYELRQNGVEGKHYNMTPNGPVSTDLGFKEIANQYFFISGRRPVSRPTPDTPDYVREAIEFKNSQIKYVEPDPWVGMKLEMPPKYKANQVPMEEKFTDVLRGRRPMSDLDKLAQEWRANGGDEARALLAKALADAKK